MKILSLSLMTGFSFLLISSSFLLLSGKADARRGFHGGGAGYHGAAGYRGANAVVVRPRPHPVATAAVVKNATD